MAEGRESFWSEWVEAKSPQEIVEMIAKQESLAETDHLTEVYNKRGWDRHVKEVTALADRLNEPTSVLMVDVDKFKAVNDTWGHEAGDQVLIFISQALKDLSRQSDVVGRLGGDEFGVMLPLTDREGAKEVKQKIVEEFERSLNEMNEDDLLATIDIKFSIGIGTREPKEKFSKAMKEADKNMYQVKRASV